MCIAEIFICYKYCGTIVNDEILATIKDRCLSNLCIAVSGNDCNGENGHAGVHRSEGF